MKPFHLLLLALGIVALTIGAFRLGTQQERASQTSHARYSDRKPKESRSLQDILNDPDPIAFRSDYLDFLKALKAEEAEAAAILLWQTTGELAEIKERQKLFAYAWGALDGEAAVEFVFSNKSVAKVSALSQAFAGWASKDPEAAKAWIESRLKPSERLLHRWALVDGWARHDPDAASAYVLGLEKLPGRGRFVRSIALEQVRRNPDDAQSWIDTLPSGPLRQTAIEETALHWSRSAPEAASEWAFSLVDSTESTHAMNTTITQWARMDIAGPATFLEKLKPGTARDHGIAAYLNIIASDDLPATSAWGGKIEDSSLREETLIRIAREALDRDPPNARNWLPESGISPEGLKRLR